MANRKDKDGGWAWMILLVASLSVVVSSGLGIVGGIFQVLFLEQFRESISYTAWVTALFSSLMQLAGPVSSLIANYFSCRTSVMLGGILMSIGLILSSFATSIEYLMVTFGIISGLGLGLTYTPSIIITNYYFHSKRNIMTGVVMSAAGVGVFIGPLLSRYLLDTFNWRETMIILAATSAQFCIYGAVMFPIHEPSTNSCTGKLIQLVCCRKGRPSINKPNNQMELRNRKEPSDDSNTQDKCLEKEYYQIVEKEPFLEIPTRISENQEVKSKQFLEVKDPRILRSQDSVSLNSQLFLSRTSGLNVDVSIPKPYFLRNKQFLVFCLSLILMTAGFGGVLIHYPYLCASKGASKNDVALAISANGPALVVSRVLVGALGNADNVDYLAVYISLKAISGIFVCCIPLFEYSIGYSVSTMVILALTNGGSDSLTVGLTIDCVGLDQFAAAVGFEMICAGTGFLLAPPVIGWVVGITGSDNSAMFISGGLGILSAVVCMLIPLFKHKDSQSIGYHPQNCDNTVKIDEPTKSENC